MTVGALDARYPFHGAGTNMFLMTNRTGTMLHHVGFVKGERPLVSLGMAGLAIFVDRIKGDAVPKSITQDFLEFVRRQAATANQGFVVTARAVVDQRGVTGRKFSRVEESFVPAPLISDDGGETGGDGEKADQKTRQAPRLDPFEKVEVAFVLLGDLLLRSSGRGHRLNSKTG